MSHPMPQLQNKHHHHYYSLSTCGSGDPDFFKETLSQDAVVSRGMHHTSANHRQNFAVSGHGLAQLKLNQIMNKNRPVTIS